MYHGLINVCKEAGMTSHDVVARLRKILHMKKIGHTGTLDPEAVGVLVVTLGDGTKLTSLLGDHVKEYIAVCRLGVTTDTGDLTGTVLEERAVSVTREALHEAVQRFQGTYEQVPPMYSAIRVNGRHLYELAREGKTVERKPRTVRIEAIRILDDSMLEETKEFTFEVRCSAGTYIRTLCTDIGEALSCGASMAHLTRTAVGAFHLSDALTLAQIETLHEKGELQENAILPPEAFFRDLDMIHALDDASKGLRNGNALPLTKVLEYDEAEGVLYEDKTMVRAYDADGVFAGIMCFDARKKQFGMEYYFYRETT